jgi:hypothetical protein
VLQISKESRREGLKWYQASFCVGYCCNDFSFETEPQVYCNYASDRLCYQENLVMDRDRHQAWDDFMLNFKPLKERGPKSIAINIEPSFENSNFEVPDILPPDTKSLEEIFIHRY